MKSILFLVILCGITGATLSSCSAPVRYVELTGKTMGTTYSVKYYGVEISSQEIHDEINSYLEDFNDIFSTYIPKSEISRLNSSSDVSKLSGIPVSKKFQTVLNRALNIASRSRGYFDPTVYPLVSLWKSNFKEKNQDTLPSQKEIFNALNRVGYQKIKIENGKVKLREGMSIDLSAIAKGSGVDGVAGLLESHGIKNYLVEIGGEIRVNGFNWKGEPWKLLIFPPVDPQSSIATEVEKVVIPLTSGGMATSGDYLNYFMHKGIKYSHLIDPHNGNPIHHYVTSVSVIADTCEEADGWATALIVMGEDGILFSEEQGIPAVFMVRKDGGEEITVIKNSWIDKLLN